MFRSLLFAAVLAELSFAAMAPAEQILGQKPIDRRFPTTYCPFETRDFGIYFTATGPTATLLFEAPNSNPLGFWNANRIDNVTVSPRTAFEAHQGVAPGYESCYEDPLPGFPNTGANAPAFFFNDVPSESLTFLELFDDDADGWDLSQGAYFLAQNESTNCTSEFPKPSSAPRFPELGNGCTGGSLALGDSVDGNIVVRTSVLVTGLVAGTEYAVTGWWDTNDSLSNTLQVTVTGPDDPAQCSPNHLYSWGGYGTGNGQFLQPTAIAARGKVYVTDLSDRVQKFDSDGTFRFTWGSEGSGPSQFQQPAGIAIGPDGSIYVSDQVNHRIQKFTKDGVYLLEWGSFGFSGDGVFNYPTGLAVDAGNAVYVVDTGNHRIQVFSSTGAFIRKWGSLGNGDGQFNYPYYAADDGSGGIYVTDSYNHRVQKFSYDGLLEQVWGSPGSGNGQFNHPRGIAVDAGGDVYVVDGGNQRIQKFDANGNFRTTWGPFFGPSGIAIDETGNIHVAEQGSRYVHTYGPVLPAVSLPIYTGQPGVWKATTGTPGAGWNTSLGYNDCEWLVPQSMQLSSTPPATVVWSAGSGICDPAPADVWFRGKFRLGAVPSSAQLVVGVDDDCDIYVNGTLVVQNSDCWATILGPYDIAPHLRSGENLIAVKAQDCDGWCHGVHLRVSPGQSGLTELPTSLPPLQVAPNPFQSGVTLTLSLPEAARVGVEVFDIAGRCVRRFDPMSLAPGEHSVIWDGRSDTGRELGNGIFFLRVRQRGFEISRKIVKFR